MSTRDICNKKVFNNKELLKNSRSLKLIINLNSLLEHMQPEWSIITKLGLTYDNIKKKKEQGQTNWDELMSAAH